MANISKMTNKLWIARAVEAVKDAENQKKCGVSYYQKRQLIKQGFLKIEKVNAAGRGRPKSVYKPTKRGQAYINLSVSWV